MSTIQQVNDQLAARLREISSLQAQLEQPAIRDSLTSLFNRRYMKETLEREVVIAARQSESLSIVG